MHLYSSADDIVFRETNLSGVKIAAVRFRATGKRVIFESSRSGGQIPRRANTYHDNKRLTRF